MVILDANVLIYGHFEDSAQHSRIEAWLGAQFAGPGAIGLTWISLWNFLRISTNRRLWPRPPTVEACFERVEEWLNQPNVVLIGPGPRHQTLLRALMIGSESAGTLATDAALAAIAIEHAATLASTDRDFRRFSGLRWVNPLD